MTEDNEYAKPALLAEIDMKPMRPDPTNVSDVVGKITKAMEWQPIETAPEGRCLMWVADGGERGRGCTTFGNVYVYEDSRSYRPEGYHGKWNVTHWMPLPSPPGAAATESTLSSQASLLEETEAKLAEAVKVISHLERAASEVSCYGAQAGPQWVRLTGPLVAARSFLATLKAKLSQEKNNAE